MAVSVWSFFLILFNSHSLSSRHSTLLLHPFVSFLLCLSTIWNAFTFHLLVKEICPIHFFFELYCHPFFLFVFMCLPFPAMNLVSIIPLLISLSSFLLYWLDAISLHDMECVEIKRYIFFIVHTKIYFVLSNVVVSFLIDLIQSFNQPFLFNSFSFRRTRFDWLSSLCRTHRKKLKAVVPLICDFDVLILSPGSLTLFYTIDILLSSASYFIDLLSACYRSIDKILTYIYTYLRILF